MRKCTVCGNWYVFHCMGCVPLFALPEPPIGDRDLAKEYLCYELDPLPSLEVLPLEDLVPLEWVDRQRLPVPTLGDRKRALGL